MSYSTGSPLVLTGRPPSAEQLWAAFAPMTPAGETGRVRQALAVLAGVGAACRCDPIILAAIAWIETGEAGTGLPWRSRWWRGRNNAGNLGVTGDPAQDAASQRWQTPHDGAVALVAHYVAYAWGSRWRSAWDTDALGLPNVQDKRFQTVLEATGGVPVDTLGGLSGRWSTDMAYGDKLAERCNALMTAIAASATDPIVTTPATDPEPIESEDAMSNVFGRVPHPFYQDRIVTNSTAWNDLSKRTIRAVVWHRMYGTLWGTDGYFRGEASGRALTDYGVGVAATDGASQAGVILRWNDPNGRRSPWASGPAQNPVGDAVPFIARYGVNGVNRDAVSIEISGNGDTPLDANARAAVVALTAYWADQYKVPWESFPAVPGEGRSFVMWHGEIYDGKRNSCPGAVVMAATDAMIEEVKAILKQYQTATPPPVEPSEPVYATPQPPAAGDSIVNGRIFLAHAQTYTTKRAVTPRIYADPGSDPTGPVIKKGSTVKTSHVVSDVGESADLTAVLEDGSRIPIAGILV